MTGLMYQPMRKPAFWVAYAVVAVACAVLAWRLFPLAIPLVNLDIKMALHEAVAKAEGIAHGEEAGPRRCAHCCALSQRPVHTELRRTGRRRQARVRANGRRHGVCALLVGSAAVQARRRRGSGRALPSRWHARRLYAPLGGDLRPRCRDQGARTGGGTRIGTRARARRLERRLRPRTPRSRNRRRRDRRDASTTSSCSSATTASATPASDCA